MEKTFLFGKFYDKNELKDIANIMKARTPYEINKNTFLTDIYDNEDTIKKSYNYFKNNTIVSEKIKEKDLMDFTTPELIILMNNLTTTSVNTKNRVYYLIYAYLDWAVSKKYIPMNNLQGIAKDDLIKINKKMVSYKYTNISDLDDDCIKAVNSQNVSVIDVLPLIIARYGILGREMNKLLNLRWDDIDYDCKVVRLLDGDDINIYPVDDVFLKWIKLAKECVSFESVEYVDEGRVIKRWKKNEELDNTIINNRLTRAFQKTKIQRISLKSLELSRKIDLLLEIREERVLKSEDFREVVSNFDKSASPATTNVLIKEYEALTDDKVQPMRSKSKIQYIDDNPKETVRKIRKILGIN